MASFVDIEKKRADAGIPQADLCSRAGVHPTTYSRQKVRPGQFGASERTLQKLAGALDDLINEKGKADA